jgi:hypothetical protein
MNKITASMIQVFSWCGNISRAWIFLHIPGRFCAKGETMSTIVKTLLVGVFGVVFVNGCGGGGTDDTTDPVFTSVAEATVAENQTSAITLTATDDGSSVTITINGDDAASFTLAASGAAASGDLGAASASVKATFKNAPDFETKDTYTFTPPLPMQRATPLPRM